MIAYAPPTRFDLRFSLFGFPVRVHPLFWLIAFLLGGRLPLLGIFAWVVAVFVSILVHELGHALALRQFGQRSQIVLHSMGGLTIPEPVSWGTGWANVALTLNQEMFISLAGPGAGFLFAAFILLLVSLLGGSIFIELILGFIPIPMASFPSGNVIVNTFVVNLLWVNIFWGLLNLMPIYPLDGGNVARNLFVKSDPWGGVRKSLWLSVIAAGVIALAGILFFQSIYMMLMFALLAFQSYQLLNGGMGRY